MSTTEGRGTGASNGRVDMKLEVVVVPVLDADHAKEFYAGLGRRLDADRTAEDFRLVQFTPPGSGCSIQFGSNLTSAEPGSFQGLLLIVSDIEAAHDELVRRGVNVSGVFHCPTGSVCRFRDADGSFQCASGPAPDHGSYGSFVSFSDPDGNGWLFQEITTCLPGRIDPGQTSFASAGDLASALRRAATAHSAPEQHIGEADANWANWYADYISGGAVWRGAADVSEGHVAEPTAVRPGPSAISPAINPAGLTRRSLLLRPIADQGMARGMRPGMSPARRAHVRRDREGVPHIASGPLPDSEGGTP